MKKLRLARGFTQEQMAVWMYMDQSTYCRLERGKRKVNAEELERFCSLVGITVDAYMNGDLHPRLPNGDTFKGATQAGEQVGSDGFLRDMLDRKDRQIEETQGLMRSMLELLRATLEQRRKRNSPGGGGINHCRSGSFTSMPPICGSHRPVALDRYCGISTAH